MTIRQIIKLFEGAWYVSYTTIAPCGCMIVRDKVRIDQKEQPTTKQIENAIKRKDQKK